MSFGFIATVLNVIVLATIKNSDRLLSEPTYVLIANACVSNIAISSFVKLMSVILCGHAVATGRTVAVFQFCSLFLFCQRLTWSVLPTTVMLLPWAALLPRLRLLSRARGKPTPTTAASTEAVLTARWEMLRAQQVNTPGRAHPRW
jgi:hypothetical protein